MPHQDDLFAPESEVHLISQLLAESRLYRTRHDFRELLAFAKRLRNLSPFNALLLHVQKPGLTYAASARDWEARFGRTIKDGARPLLILRPFGPVDLVYDIQDTEGPDLPHDVESFHAVGPITAHRIAECCHHLEQQRIRCEMRDVGDRAAGSIDVVERPPSHVRDRSFYRLFLNGNHTPNVQFCTLAHELAHLCLGHLGQDQFFRIRNRSSVDLNLREFEAEAAAYLVCERQGVEPDSHRYLAGYVDGQMTLHERSLYEIMRAAGQVEGLLGLAPHGRVEMREPRRSEMVDDRIDLFGQPW